MARAATDLTGTLLMPKATAVWLIDNTMLTFKQIAEFTALTEMEVEALANGEIGVGLVGRNPIEHKELTQEELDRCQADETASLTVSKSSLPPVKSRAKGPRYTPVAKRADKPNAIAYILKHYPEITDAQICKLIGTTKPTVQSIRDRTHAGISELKPNHPADLGLCSYQEFESVYNKALKAAGKDPEAVKKERLAQQAAAMAPQDEPAERSGGFDFSNFMPDASAESVFGPSSDDDQSNDE